MRNHQPASRSRVRHGMLLALTAATVALAAGCQAPPAPEGPTHMLVQVQSEADRDRLWTAATDALQDNYFDLDRVDRLAGVITTHPETAGNWFEFWRPQSADPYQWWQNNLDTIQRTARIRIARIDEKDEYDLDVEVRRDKLHVEERQIDNAAAALRLYSSDVPTASGRKAPMSQTSYTTDVGRDPGMEYRLLDAILLNYQQINPPELASAAGESNTTSPTEEPPPATQPTP